MSDGTQYSQGDRLFRQAWTLLGHLGVHMTPANYELMCEVLSGRKPDLRARFKALPRPVTQAHLNRLVDEYLPHHGLPATLASAGEAATSAIGMLEGEFATSQQDLAFQLKHLTILKARLPQVHELKSMTAQDVVIDLETALTAHSETLQRLKTAVDAGQDPVTALKSLLGRLKEQPVSQAIIAMRDPSLLHGFGDGQAMKTQLEQLYQAPSRPSNISLLLCHLTGLDKYRTPQLARAGAHLAATLSRRVKGMIDKGESAYWLTSDRLGLLLNTEDALAVRQVGNQIGTVVDTSLADIRRTITAAPDVSCQFGSASAQGSDTAAHFFMSANRELQQMEAAVTEQPAGADSSDAGHGAARYSVLYGREQAG